MAAQDPLLEPKRFNVIAIKDNDFDLVDLQSADDDLQSRASVKDNDKLNFNLGHSQVPQMII